MPGRGRKISDKKSAFSKVQSTTPKSERSAGEGVASAVESVDKGVLFPNKAAGKLPDYGSNDTLEVLKVIPTNVVEANLDEVLSAVKIVDNLCDHDRCKAKTSLMGDTCVHCNKRFCFKHCLPEVHGCGQAAKHKERKEFMHSNIKPVKLVRQEANREQAKKQLKNKLLQMQMDRKKK